MWLIATFGATWEKKRTKRKEKKTLLHLFEKIRKIKNKNWSQKAIYIYLINKKPKWPSLIGRCRKSGNHPWKGLAKSGYKQDMKFKNFSHPSIISLATHSKKQIYIEKFGEFNYFPPHFWRLKTSSKSLHIFFVFFNFL